MSCSNCFNGCAEIVSDKCVKYTGINVSALGIENGDSLCTVEQALANYLVTALDGTGVVPAIDPRILCEIVTKYLPISGVINLVDIIAALIQSACDIQVQIDGLVENIEEINADYDIACLDGVMVDSGTHDIVQAVISNLCALNDTMTALLNSLPLTYVTIATLNVRIQSYLDSLGSSTLMSNRMVPYTAVEFYGDLTGKFDGSGAGIVNTDWENIYLCNGRNGTPDKRGVVPVGATTGTLGGVYDSKVDPAIAGNPTYTLGDAVSGNNTIQLTTPELPSHTHIATATATQVPHYHLEFSSDMAGGTNLVATAISYASVSKDWGTSIDYAIEGNTLSPILGRSSTETPIITVSVSNTYTGTGAAHSNIQPVLPCFYIMYIP